MKVKKGRYNIKKGKIALIGSIVILLVLTFLIIYSTSIKDNKAASPPPEISPEIEAEIEKKIKEAEEMTSLLYKSGGYLSR